jgi:hypothetical protein
MTCASRKKDLRLVYGIASGKAEKGATSSRLRVTIVALTMLGYE